MPTKKVDDANYWKARRGRFQIPELPPSANPAVLPSEDPAEFDALTAEYYARFQPAYPEERCYIDDIIYCEWLLRRLRRTEIELNTYVYENASHTHPDYPMGQPAAERPKVFTALAWRMISTRKALREAFAALRELRANPIPDAPTDNEQTPLPEIGFVPVSQASRPVHLAEVTPAAPSPHPHTLPANRDRQGAISIPPPGTPANAPRHRPSPITE